MNKFLVGLITAGAIGAMVASSACTVTVDCIGGTIDCDGICVDTDNDPDDCGGCGLSCGAGEDCVAGNCTSGACTDDPVISVAGLSATDNGDGTIDLAVPFSDPCGEGVDAYTFQTDDNQVDDVDVSVPLVVSGTLDIQNINMDNETGSVGFHVQVYAGARESAAVDGTISL